MLGTASVQHDAAGNVTSDGLNSYSYSGRGRLASMANAGGTASYSYNAQELRVSKSGPTALVPTGNTYYVYDEAGQLLGEYDANGAPLYETIYLGMPVGVIKQTGTAAGANIAVSLYNASVAGAVLEYIEATLADIALANRIAHEVLGVSLDELPPQTRRMFAGVQALVRQKMAAQGLPQRDIRFSRSEVRAATGLSDTQARIHLERLAALEYLLTHRGQRGQSFEYELLYDQGSEQAGSDDGPHLSGLIDTAALKSTATNPSSRGQAGEFAAPSRGQNGPNAGDARTSKTPASPHEIRRIPEMPDEVADSSATPTVQARSPYLQPLAA